MRFSPPPRRIDKDAASILDAACRATKAILDRRAALDRAGRRQQPLIVLAGEYHDMPAHTLHFIEMVDKLREKEERIAVCLEYAHNTVEELFAKKTGHPPDTAEAAFLRAADRTGTLSMQSNLEMPLIHAPHTQALLSSFLLHQSIPVRFTDAAVMEEDFIDDKDPSTAVSLRACFNGTAPSGIENTGPEGVWIRNHHMMTLSLDFAKACNARVVLQQCGNYHVAGNDATGIDPRRSLSALCKARGAAVLALPVLTQRTGEYALPADHRLRDTERFLVSGLPEMRVAYDPVTGRPIPRNGADLRCQADEAAYANALLPEWSGLGAARLTIGGYRRLKKECRQETERIFAAARVSP